jgi:hypothetical protein
MMTQVDFRLGNSPVYYLFPQEDMNMRVPDPILKSVVFIGVRNEDGEPVYRSTAFFVSVPGAFGELSWIYLVTAKHVAEKIAHLPFVVRVNRRNDSPLVLDGAGTKWWYHPTAAESVDAAATFWSLPPEIGKQLDIACLPIAMFMSDEVFQKHNIGVGDQVFITGLFTDLQDTSRNLPIVRTGNVALMPDEKIPFRNGKLLEAYLIESRSIGGLSGCPVFVRGTNMLRGLKNDAGENSTACVSSNTFFLLGSMIGHWDAPPSLNPIHEEKVNMGISTVTPAKQIRGIINHPELVEMRKKWDEDVLKKRSEGATFDMAEDEGDSFTQKDFEAALRKASRKVAPSKSDSETT